MFPCTPLPRHSHHTHVASHRTNVIKEQGPWEVWDPSDLNEGHLDTLASARLTTLGWDLCMLLDTLQTQKPSQVHLAPGKDTWQMPTVPQ